MTAVRATPPDPRVELCGQSPVTSLTFGKTGTPEQLVPLFSGHQNGKIIEWNLSTHRPTSSWPGHTDTVLWMSWARNILLSQGRDGVLRLWIQNKLSSAPSWTKFGEVPCAPLTFCNSTILFCEDTTYLALPSDKTAQVDVFHLRDSALTAQSIDIKTQQTSSLELTRSIKPTNTKAYGMCMRLRSYTTKSSLPRLLVAYESGILVLWDLLKGQLLSEAKGHDETIMCMDCWTSQDSTLIRCVTGSVDNGLQLWHLEGDKLVKSGSVAVTNPGINDIVIRRDGRIFATGGWDHIGRVFSLKKLTPLAVLTYHKESVQCVTFAPDNTLATGSKDGYIALWDIYKDK